MTTSFSFAFHLAYRENICDETLFSTWDVFPLDRNNLQIPFFSLYAQITLAGIEQEIYKYVSLLISRLSLCLSELGRPGYGWGHPLHVIVENPLWYREHAKPSIESGCHTETYETIDVRIQLRNID